MIGGSKTAGQFAQAGLIDEVYLDVEPVTFGRGLPIFTNTDFELKLSLESVKKLNGDTVQLHYLVKR